MSSLIWLHFETKRQNSIYFMKTNMVFVWYFNLLILKMRSLIFWKPKFYYLFLRRKKIRGKSNAISVYHKRYVSKPAVTQF